MRLCVILRKIKLHISFLTFYLFRKTYALTERNDERSIAITFLVSNFKDIDVLVFGYINLKYLKTNLKQEVMENSN